MIEYLFSHQEGLDLFAMLPKRLKRINGVPVDEWLKAHEHEERTCHMTHDESASRAMCGPAVRCSAYGLSCVAAVALVASAQPGDPPGPETVPEVRGRTPPVAAYVDEG